jgi:polysaccharide pyruvyl transferase WcaK-like protein
MRVLHSYCLNYNFGDYALGFGTKKILREVYDIDYIAETNLQGQIFNDYYISMINDRYDLLVIGGGGIIHGAHWPNGWFWLIEKEKIKEIKIPFIIYSAGYNYFKDEHGIPVRGIAHLQETYNHAALFSIRNDGSHARLFEQTSINANVVADPGFWFSLDYPFSNNPFSEKYVIVELADDKPIHRFNSLENREIFISKISLYLSSLSDKYKIVFVPHVFEDIGISIEVSKNVKNSVVTDFSKSAFEHYYQYMGIYKHAEFVLAMRGHGQIIPLSFEVPAISLENHHKHRGLMEEYGLGKYNIEILQNNFESVLAEVVNDLEINLLDIKKHCKEKNKALYNESCKQLSSIDALKQFLKN